MSEHTRFNCHPLTLSFRGQTSYLEPLFLREYSSGTNLVINRLSLLSGILIYAAFGIFDTLLVSGSARNTLLLFRFLIVCPLLLLILLSTYHPFLRRLHQPLLAVGNCVAGSVLVLMIPLVPANMHAYYMTGLLLVFMYTYGMGQLRFIWATASGWAVLIFFLLMTTNDELGRTDSLTGLFFLTSANFIGMLIAYALEYSSRKNFFLQQQLRQEEHKLHQLNESLEETVKKRTASLIQINNKLNSEIQERIRAEKERQQIETQLIQAQKMEAIGTLAGGIAHDFNNILTVINGTAELALYTIDKKQKEYSAFKQILKAGQRAKDLVAQILTFSRLKPEVDAITNMVPLLKGTINLIRSTAPATIAIKSSLTAKDLHVRADATRLDQIIMNLCTNAIHVLEERGGILSIELRGVELNQAQTRQYPGLVPGPYGELVVADNGPGMPAAVVEHIFEPFFTTKEKGKGTGLGLSVVHGIVKSLKGVITVDTTPGEGTTFRVWLPLIDQTASPAPAEAQPAVLRREKTQKQILLIDDEPDIVSLGEQILSELGYQVTGSADPKEALEIFQQKSNKFDLVITDITMPGLTGDQLAEAMRKIRPHLPILFCTGYSTKLEKATMLEKCDGLLFKPVSVLEYSTAVRKALGE